VVTVNHEEILLRLSIYG